MLAEFGVLHDGNMLFLVKHDCDWIHDFFHTTSWCSLKFENQFFVQLCWIIWFKNVTRNGVEKGGTRAASTVAISEGKHRIGLCCMTSSKVTWAAGKEVGGGIIVFAVQLAHLINVVDIADASCSRIIPQCKASGDTFRIQVDGACKRFHLAAQIKVHRCCTKAGFIFFIKSQGWSNEQVAWLSTNYKFLSIACIECCWPYIGISGFECRRQRCVNCCAFLDAKLFPVDNNRFFATISFNCVQNNGLVVISVE